MRSRTSMPVMTDSASAPVASSASAASPMKGMLRSASVSFCRFHDDLAAGFAVSGGIGGGVLQQRAADLVRRFQAEAGGVQGGLRGGQRVPQGKP